MKEKNKTKKEMESFWTVEPFWMAAVILVLVIFGTLLVMRADYDDYVNSYTTFEVSIPGEEEVICDNYRLDDNNITVYIGNNETSYTISDRDSVKITKIVDENCKSFKDYMIKDNVEWGKT